MIDLRFAVEKVESVVDAASPHLALSLRITQMKSSSSSLVSIRNILLHTQIRIEPTKRDHDEASQERLRDLFGQPHQWGQTLRGMLWTHVDITVPAFTEGIVVDMPIPCTFDFNVAATKYFAALDQGDIPLTLLFSGSIFYQPEGGGLQIVQIPWSREAECRLPVQVWREMMDRHYPNTAWLCLRRDVFEQLARFKRDHGLPTWEQALERLLTRAGKEAQS